MIKTFLFVVVASVSNVCFAEVYSLSGQITSGQIFVIDLTNSSGPPQSMRPVESFPFNYTAQLTINPAGQVAEFLVTGAHAGLPNQHAVAQNLFPTVAINDTDRLSIDFISPGAVQALLDLDLNKATGVGEWEYKQTCLACGAAFTGFNDVQATITSFSVVPEPHSLLSVAALVMAVFANRRLRPSR